MHPKKSVYEDQKEKGETKPSNVIILTALLFDKDDLIQHIYPARQLSYDEAHRKVSRKSLRLPRSCIQMCRNLAGRICTPCSGLTHRY